MLSIKQIIILIFGVAIGIVLGNFLSTAKPQMSADASISESGGNDGPCAGGSKAIAWRNPMNPAITSPVFTQDEMGMDYLPICSGGEADAVSGTVKIDATVVQNIGVRTRKVEQKTISHTIRTVGRVTMDEQRIARLHPKFEGWVEQLFIDKTGEKVSKDTMLLAIYSPQLVASGEEYLLALKNWQKLKNSPFKDIRDGAKELLQTSLNRLKLLDVPEHQLREIRNTRKVPKALHIHSPFDGIVMHIGAREGQRITANTELYRIADLSKVWVQVDIYEDELPWVKSGETAQMRLPAIPGKIFSGKVSYIYPYLEGKTRTNKVRIEFENPDLLLKPDMFANITLQTSPADNALVIPSEAIVRTGAQEQVFVMLEQGKFEPRKVTLGLQSDGEVQILSGLNMGEEVVTSSQFLIDSESKLKEATEKMLQNASSSNQQTEANSMDIEDMNMDEMDMNDMNMDNMNMDELK
ncbi:MAG: efflux RND transporter periplasmic adaptor subunit, partial [Saprospiraceae bacterium]